MVLTDQSQIIDNHQIPQIIYQPNTQQIQTSDGQIHYIQVQEDDLQNDNYNIVQQPQQPQQIYYQKITTNENGQQIIQHGISFLKSF